MKTIICFLFFLFLLGSFYANSSTIDEFLAETPLVTYDCPEPRGYATAQSLFQRLDEFTPQQKLHLSVLFSHYLICNGRAQDAENVMRQSLTTSNINKNSQVYIRANYALGLALDFQEKNERCELYFRARELSQGKVDDVNVSSKLAIINYCSEDTPFFDKMNRAYDLLKLHADTQNNGLLAHIHNAIGLLYVGKNMHYLAAEEFLKAHELGVSVYQGSNKLSLLVSAIVSLSASGQHDEMKVRLEEFRKINESINTPTTNLWYLLQLANHRHAVNDFEALGETLEEWNKLKNQISNPAYNVYFEMYEGIVCLERGEEECVQRYLEALENESPSKLRILRKNTRFLDFNVRANLMMGNLEKAAVAFQAFKDLENSLAARSEVHNTALQVSQLREKIRFLEERKEKQDPYWASISIILGIFLFFIVIAGYMKRRHSSFEQVDRITNLLNHSAVTLKLKKLHKPKHNMMHALVIFDTQKLEQLGCLPEAYNTDVVLEEASKIFNSVTRDKDILGVLSGRKIVLCLTDISEKTTQLFVERVKLAFQSTVFINEVSAPVILEDCMSVYISNDKLNQIEEIINEMLNSIRQS